MYAVGTTLQYSTRHEATTTPRHPSGFEDAPTGGAGAADFSRALRWVVSRRGGGKGAARAHGAVLCGGAVGKRGGSWWQRERGEGRGACSNVLYSRLSSSTFVYFAMWDIQYYTVISPLGSISCTSTYDVI